jgi:hypothetical protein
VKSALSPALDPREIYRSREVVAADPIEKNKHMNSKYFKFHQECACTHMYRQDMATESNRKLAIKS